MNTQSSSLVALSWILLSWVASLTSGCITDEFTLGKNTWATSNSLRDYQWALKLIPGIEDQGATKFNQGKCGLQSKLVLEDSCFKIHHPTTWEHEQYETRISEIETLFTKKIESLKSQNGHNYDSFLDHNIGFYVKEIDSLIELFNEYNVNYWVLTWNWDILDTRSMIFYSLLVHSPESQILYEFMTNTEPVNAVDSNNNEIEFLQSEMRATFDGFKPQYPWQPESKYFDYTILPIKISRAVSNLEENVEFYENILKAKTIYKTENYETISMNGDNIATKYAFVMNAGTSVEISFVERDLSYTQSVSMDGSDIESFVNADLITIDATKEEETETGEKIETKTIAAMIDMSDKDDSYYVNKYSDYSIKDWENSLHSEHNNIIKNEFCGFSRWFDNHYGMQLWEFDGLLDQILTNLRKYNIKYRVFKQTYQHTSDDGKELLDKYNKDTVYSLWVVEPSGQTLHIGGDLTRVDDEFVGAIPTWNPQWCYQECSDSDVSEDLEENFYNYNNDKNMLKKRTDSEKPIVQWLVIGACVVVGAVVLSCFYYYFWLKRFNATLTRTQARKPEINEYVPLIA